MTKLIKRLLEERIREKAGKGKAIIILGARQTGKTTLLSTMLKDDPDTLWLDADEAEVKAVFENPSSGRLKAFFGNKRNIVLDEAQRIGNIGIKLKLVTDHIPAVNLFVTGSSAFELANSINEPLTGRKWEYRLFPLSFSEMAGHKGLLEERRMLNHRLVYGYYPEVVTGFGSEKEILKQLSDSYLYKDILMWGNIKRPEKLVNLLQLLAFQVGSEVSYNELARSIGLDNETIEKYISLLERTFIIFRLGALSRNLRKEVRLSRKIYFYDNGIRNSLVSNFNPPEIRSDSGALWENFIISERIKRNHYSNTWVNSWFWRTQDQQEADYIEECDGTFHVYEMKWKPGKRAWLSKTFIQAYPGSSFEVITPDNFEQFINQ